MDTVSAADLEADFKRARSIDVGEYIDNLNKLKQEADNKQHGGSRRHGEALDDGLHAAERMINELNKKLQNKDLEIYKLREERVKLEQQVKQQRLDSIRSTRELSDKLQASEGMVKEIYEKFLASERKAETFNSGLHAAEGIVKELNEKLRASERRVNELNEKLQTSTINNMELGAKLQSEIEQAKKDKKAALIRGLLIGFSAAVIFLISIYKIYAPSRPKDLNISETPVQSPSVTEDYTEEDIKPPTEPFPHPEDELPVEEKEYYTVIKGVVLNVRTGPSTNDSIIRAISTGELLELLDEEIIAQNDMVWCKVLDVAIGDIGWVSKMYIEPAGINVQPSVNIQSSSSANPSVDNNSVVSAAVIDFEYTTENGNVIITRYTGNAPETVIPSEIDNKRVTVISNGAFSWCRSLKSITIPNSVTTISDGAFSGCEALTSITIPDGVVIIGNGAFSACYSITSITIPNSVVTIGDFAFSGCEVLTGITIPNGVTVIGEWAFSECRSLTNITIPDSVIAIGDAAFYNTSLSDTARQGIIKINPAAFTKP